MYMRKIFVSRIALSVIIQQTTFWNIFFFLFYPENRIWYFMQIASNETFCMKCQILFSGKKKYVDSLSAAKLAQRLVKVKCPREAREHVP